LASLTNSVLTRKYGYKFLLGKANCGKFENGTCFADIQFSKYCMRCQTLNFTQKVVFCENIVVKFVKSAKEH
jgi:hypothetical protein